MHTLILAGICSFVLSMFLTPYVRNAFVANNLVDLPDGERKLHEKPIPRVGGIPIMVSYAISILLAALVSSQTSEIVFGSFDVVKRLFPAVLMMFVTGLIDDLIGLKPWQKLLGQFGASVWAVMAGVNIHNLRGVETDAWWLIPLTIFWLMACSNAFNLIDGLDGLASGIGLFATVTIMMVALMTNNMSLALATVPLGGALLGFLRYNFNPASIFLGDCGSLTVGFLLGCYGVIWSQKATTLLGMTAPLIALSIPIIDTGLSIARRFLRGQPIFSGDRGHIHHRLLARGFTVRRVALTLYAVSGVVAALSLCTSAAPDQLGGLVIVLFCAAAWAGVQQLGYVEFSMARRLLLGGGFRRKIAEQLVMHQFEQHLAAAHSVPEFWHRIREGQSQFGFRNATLCCDGEIFEDITPHMVRGAWQLQIDLEDGDFLRLERWPQIGDSSVDIAAFVETVQRNWRIHKASGVTQRAAWSSQSAVAH